MVLLQIEKKTIQQSQEGITKPDLIERLRIKRLQRASLEDKMFFCTCAHLNTGHALLVGKCAYDYCNCKKFVQLEFEMEIIITNADVFSYENPELIYDSPQWWLKLGEKLNDKA